MLAFWMSADGPAWNVGPFWPRTPVSQPTPVSSGSPTRAGLGLNAGLDASFASYRSAGGHALAQVIVPAEELVGVAAKAAQSPFGAMLGIWRAALGR